MDVKIERIGIDEHIPLFIVKYAEIGGNALCKHSNDRPHDDIQHIKIALDFEVAVQVEKKVAIRSILDIREKIKQFKIRTVIHIIKIKWRYADGVVKHDAAVDANYDE